MLAAEEVALGASGGNRPLKYVGQKRGAGRETAEAVVQTQIVDPYSAIEVKCRAGRRFHAVDLQEGQAKKTAALRRQENIVPLRGLPA